MGIYFGTDGFRGIVGQTMSPSVAYRIGNALGGLSGTKKVLIGRDSRQSGSVLSLALSGGLASAGAQVTDIGIAPTPAVAYLTKKLGFDYGVVVSASHNPKEYNGIKIFDHNGFKISETEEAEIERNLLYCKEKENDFLGKYIYKPKLKKEYKKELYSLAGDLSGLKIAIDCANGASCRIAQDVFEKSGADVIATNCKFDGLRINEDCGALHPEKIAQTVVKENCDIGFAFDGDADRIIACDEKGNILDGDDLLFLLAKSTLSPFVVGTSMTNKGLENALSDLGKTLLRADVGDKYVSQLMKNCGATLGGETSGHIIDFTLSSTGDGVLCATQVAKILKQSGQSASEICHCPKLPLITKSIPVNEKWRLVSHPKLKDKIELLENEIGNTGRILVRASGTENKIRLMCECKDEKLASRCVEELAKEVELLNENEF